MNGDDRDPDIERLLAATDEEARTASPADAEAAWRRFQARRMRTPPPRWRWPLRPAWLAASAVVALVGVLGFSPAARSATVRMLSLFRATRIEALPIAPSPRAPINNRAITSRIGRLLANDARVTLEEKNQAASGAAAASRWAGFAVRYAPLWEGLRPSFQLRGAKRFQLRVNLPQVQAILSAAGVAGPRLPPSLNGASIAVQLPRALTIAYGNCAAWSARALAAPLPPPPLTPDCTVLGEGPSPVVQFPAGLDMRDIAVVGLQLLGMSAQQARQYTRTVDWSSTLVVPFLAGEAASRPVALDGVHGVLLTRSHPGAEAHYVLLWSRQGMIYSISGPGDGSHGLALARQLAATR